MLDDPKNFVNDSMPAEKKKSPKSVTARTNFFEAVYRVVRKIPKGKIMTYGQIATILGAPRAARAVGYAMRAAPQRIPWQRVINAKGQISARSEVERPIIQKMLLKSEGIEFDDAEACDLDTFRWEPRNPGRFFHEASKDAPF